VARCSVIKASVTRGQGRVDPEYFDPRDLKAIVALSTAGAQPLSVPCHVKTGRGFTGGYTDDGELIVVRAGDLVAPLIYADCGQAFLRVAKDEKVLSLKKGDVLVSAIGLGSIGKVSLVVDPIGLVTVPEVIVLRPKENFELGAGIYAFFRTTLGKRLIDREVTGATGQQHLLRTKMQSVLVPTLPDALCHRLYKTLEEAWDKERGLHKDYASIETQFTASMAGLPK